jgi:putative restriction endonuclease
MRFLVHPTDNDWYSFLEARRPDEVNFWKPGGGIFNALEVGDLFFFKLKKPYNHIAGGGLFLRYPLLPLSLVWKIFGAGNGTADFHTFRQKILAYRSKMAPGRPPEIDPVIGSIVLTQPFFFPREQWIPVRPELRFAVQGKCFDLNKNDEEGRQLWEQIKIRLAGTEAVAMDDSPAYGRAPTQLEAQARYRERLTRVRIGQGGFRILVTEAYDRRCAITGEKTLPVLEAAHIRRYAEAGPHAVQNGLLLRADMHILFDAHYITITPEKRILISSQIQQQFTNGKLYYSYHGAELRSLPQAVADHPDRQFLSWHNERFIA